MLIVIFASWKWIETDREGITEKMRKEDLERRMKLSQRETDRQRKKKVFRQRERERS